MAKKKQADRHDPKAVTVRLSGAYRARLERIIGATRRNFATEVRLALDKYCAEMEAKIAAGQFPQ